MGGRLDDREAAVRGPGSLTGAAGGGGGFCHATEDQELV